MYVRVRPPAQNLEQGVDDAPCVEVTSSTSLVLHSKPDPKTFSFDHVANTNTTQVWKLGSVQTTNHARPQHDHAWLSESTYGGLSV